MSDTRLRDDLHPQAAEAIVTGRHGDPFSVLGMHRSEDGRRLYVRTFAPHAERVWLTAPDGSVGEELVRTHPDGLFALVTEAVDRGPDYRLKMKSGRHEWIADDPYRFGTLLGELDVYLLGEGRHRRIYERLGAHPMSLGDVEGTLFAVWAPNARRVSVVGDFNGWDGRRHPMRKLSGIGVWELFVPGLPRGLYYKYEIVGAQGNVLPLKMDPLAFATEEPPNTSSIIHGLVKHEWQDAAWMGSRAGRNDRAAPMSIYEVHLGSWRRGDGNTYLDYDALARELIPYVKDMGFTHVELLPISEHPFSGSWGYQPIGLYAPTSRFGSPEGFARFVDAAHQAEISVVIDWVPAHFPTDAHGLGNFDGTQLYEHADPREGFHKDWNTLIYNLGRNEVANFLEANGTFWLDRYHVDGLRVDAVASMLYRDYSRSHGEWVPNVHGGRENLESIVFLRSLNTTVRQDWPGAFTAAEESTAFPQVSRPVEWGGLGFNYKWNMGWMHDTLHYMQEDPVYRRFHHDNITFGLHYAFSEDFILPLSHDEVVHGKGSLIRKMPGDRWQKFANLRAYYAFMWTHPGKKLLFMGGEFAQDREWNHDQSLDWHELGDCLNKGVQDLVRDLNWLYRQTGALHQKDCDPDGFEWIDASDTQSSVFAYARYGNDRAAAVVVLNFTPVVRYNYRIGFPHGGWWREALNTDAGTYGGSNVGNGGGVNADLHPFHGREHSALLTLPPLGAVVFVPG